MSWLQCFMRVSRQQLDAFEDVLLALGAVSVTYCDAADQPLFEPGPGEIALWEEVELVGLFTEDFQEQNLRQQLSAALGDALPSVRFEVLVDQVWERAWMEHFQPMRFGERLWIYPSWVEAPQDGSVVLRLDPGLAFGTGTHPTTALCLEWLDAQNLQNKTVIDYGCGSGILAIAALKLGADSAIGVDIDEQAIRASNDNAAQNAVQAAFYLPDDLPEGQFDVVVANILANPLRMLGDMLASRTKPGGRIVLSGILDEQVEEMSDIYNQWFDLAPAHLDNGWACLSGVKR